MVCDRYFFSTIAYGSDTSEDAEWLLTVNGKIILPDIVFLLRITPRVGVERIHANRHGIRLFEKEEILKKVATNYEMLANRFPNITCVIDGEQQKNQITLAIQEKTKELFL